MATAYQQRALPLPLPITGVVNVASVPQRSPFRYAGGKTWLIPRIRRWLTSVQPRAAQLVEPFAGGAIVGLTAAAEGLAERVTLVELDADVAAVWETLIAGDGLALGRRIVDFSLTLEHVQAVFAQTPMNVADRAFATIVKNRVNRGGILAKGTGMIKVGENGKGLASRWYPETLNRRICAIVAMRDLLAFVQGDGLAALRDYADDPAAAFFIDPPYTASTKRAGSRLYTHSVIDHEELFLVAAGLKGDFLMTYDNADEVWELARRHDFDTMLVPMKNTHHTEMQELLVGRNLDWAR